MTSGSRRRADEEMLLAEFLVLLTAAHSSLVLAELSSLRLEDLLVVIKLLIFSSTTFASSCRPRVHNPSASSNDQRSVKLTDSVDR